MGEVHTIRRGKRALTFEVFGNPSSTKTIIYLHGFPGSRIEAAFAESQALKENCRLIGVDRPGFGASPSYPARTLIEFCEDLEAIADSLTLNKFYLVGCSGGVPFALACASRLPNRIHACSLVSGLGPIAEAPQLLSNAHFFNRIMLRAALVAPGLVGTIVFLLSSILKHCPHWMVAWLTLVSPRYDQCILREPAVSDLLTRNFALALSGSAWGPAHDVHIMASKWNFRLEGIGVPCHFWHGDSDSHVPFEMSSYMAGKIPGAGLTKIEGEGHFMIVKLLPQIFQQLLHKNTSSETYPSHV
jgi:pimeloyl-ACP methyl ester carboxylesterase